MWKPEDYTPIAYIANIYKPYVLDNLPRKQGNW